jgi:hypothetical protein
MEGKEIGGRNVEGINVGKKNENENDEEILKKIIASHPLFEVMIESHINCLKVINFFIFVYFFFIYFCCHFCI